MHTSSAKRIWSEIISFCMANFQLHLNDFVSCFIILAWGALVPECNHTTRATVKKDEQNGFHDNFLISQPNPMM